VALLGLGEELLRVEIEGSKDMPLCVVLGGPGVDEAEWLSLPIQDRLLEALDLHLELDEGGVEVLMLLRISDDGMQDLDVVFLRLPGLMHPLGETSVQNVDGGIVRDEVHRPQKPADPVAEDLSVSRVVANDRLPLYMLFQGLCKVALHQTKVLKLAYVVVVSRLESYPSSSRYMRLAVSLD